MKADLFDGKELNDGKIARLLMDAVYLFDEGAIVEARDVCAEVYAAIDQFISAQEREGGR